MNSLPPYRQLLLESIIIYDDVFYNLATWAVEYVFFEDELKGICPFESGDKVPLDMDLFEHSDIFEVQQIYQIMEKLIEVWGSTQNINNITDQERFAFYPLDWKPGLLPFQKDCDSWNDLRKSLVDLFRVIASRILSQCYDMVYGEDRSMIPRSGFLFPDENTLTLFQSNDVNVKMNLELVALILDKRKMIKKMKVDNPSF